MKVMKLLWLFFCAQLHAQYQVDFIIFSYDRPLQLYALLESSTMLMKGLNDIFVIYRSSNHDFEHGYALVKEAFPHVHYRQQGRKPADDFKQLVIEAFQAHAAKYVLFGVDDIVVKNEIDLDEVIALMEKHKAYGFYLRLGRNLTYCYPKDMKQPLPALRCVGGGYTWQFSRAIGDWGWPHTVDMTVYRKRDIVQDILRMYYINPNTFEGAWAGRAGPIMSRQGICYEKTRIVNLPLNSVHTSSNRHMNFITADELLSFFLMGKKMDIAALLDFENRSAHMEYEPMFINR